MITFSGSVSTSSDFGRKSHPVISELLLVPIPTTVRVCLLGLVDEVVPSCALRTQHFTERKAILFNWKKTGALVVAFWKGLVNYRTTYKARGCKKNLDKVWKTWYNSSTTVG